MATTLAILILILLAYSIWASVKHRKLSREMRAKPAPPPLPEPSPAPDVNYGHPKPVIETMRKSLPKLPTGYGYELLIVEFSGKKWLTVKVGDHSKPLEGPTKSGSLWESVIVGLIGLEDRTDVGDLLNERDSTTTYSQNWARLYQSNHRIFSNDEKGRLKRKKLDTECFNDYLIEPMVKFVADKLSEMELVEPVFIERWQQ